MTNIELVPFLPVFFIALRHSPKIFSKCCLPDLRCCRIMHEFLVAGNCLACHRVNHRGRKVRLVGDAINAHRGS
jgi:hypothetical protein